jgi:hypothetical protein
MQRYTILFITVNALNVSGGFSAHNQQLKSVRTASVICQACVSWNSTTLAVAASKLDIYQMLCVHFSAEIRRRIWQDIERLSLFYQNPMTYSWGQTITDSYTRQGTARIAHRLLRPLGRKISGFCRGIEAIFALLGCYAAYVLSLPRFRDSQYVQHQGSNSPRNSWTVWPLKMESKSYPERSWSPKISWTVWPLKMEPIGRPETSVKKLRTYAA